MKILKKLKEMNEKLPKIEFLHDALLIDYKILVISDLHIGYEDSIIERGIFPRTQLKEITEKLDGIFWNLSMKGIIISKVIILGDLKHDFGGILDREWGETLKLLDYFYKKLPKPDKNSKEQQNIILISGNHDNMIGPIIKKRGIAIKERYNYRGICFLHGHKNDEECILNSKTLVLGHLHPAITLKDRYKREKYNCFLTGKWKNKQIIILPSFSPIVFGYDLSKHKENMKNNDFFIIKDSILKNFQVVIYNNTESKTYNFGKLNNFK